MDTFKSDEQTEMVLTRVSNAPHDDGFFWRGEVDGKRDNEWEWEILEGEEGLSLSYIIQCLEKEFDNIHITIKTYINPDVGYKIVPTHIYLNYCDKGCDILKKELLKYTAKKDRKKVKRREVKKDNDYNFLMLDK
jgi:hypothetical protein